MNIISDLISKYKSFSTSVKKLATSQLPKIQQKLLNIYYEDFLSGVQKSNRSLNELSQRLGVHPKYISRNCADLQRAGLLACDPHGNESKRRWITMDAFISLETKRLPQSLPQIDGTPYINLSDQEKRDIKILEQPQSCGQLAVLDSVTNLETKLDMFFKLTYTPEDEAAQIKALFSKSNIGQQRKQEVVSRVVAAHRKKPVERKKSYFLACLKKEENELMSLFDIFRSNPIHVNLYAQL